MKLRTTASDVRIDRKNFSFKRRQNLFVDPLSKDKRLSYVFSSHSSRPYFDLQDRDS